MNDFYKDRRKKSIVREIMRKIPLRIPRSEASFNDKITECEEVIIKLEDQKKMLQDESAELLRSFEKVTGEFELLKRKYYKTNEQLIQARKQNEKLVAALEEAKTQINGLKKEVEKLCSPPNTYAVLKAKNPDGTVDISLDGRHLKVNVRPDLNLDDIDEGQLILLNEGYNVIGVRDYETSGEVAQIKSVLDDKRVVAIGRGDEEKVVLLSDQLRKEDLEIGDNVMVGTRSNFAYEKLPKTEVQEVVLEEIPSVTYNDIGGLSKQIEALRDAIELPFLYPEHFKEHKLKAPKGILLFGPPGCGKTMLAKAIAGNLAQKIGERNGQLARSYFLNVKGPELLNKYVGETELRIREIFTKAKRRAEENMPVIIYFDEMDALFRIRGSGISSDIETTIVAQFLAEIDGVESLNNVIVIGASNRQDLIDPAVLRPGRLDVKIKVDRPDEEAAKDILSKYLISDLPLHESELARFGGDRGKTISCLIEKTAEKMYAKSDENKFLEVTYARGEKEIFYLSDFCSGAMLESTVNRAKKIALKRLLSNSEKGIKLQDLYDAVYEEFGENEDLPNTTNPDDWIKISGRKGERIINIRPLMKGAVKERPVENIEAGHYL